MYQYFNFLLILFSLPANNDVVVAAGCEGQQELTATASDQYITSPGYGSRYQLYTNCTWRISVCE